MNTGHPQIELGRAAALFVVVAIGLSGCGFGTMTTWGDNSNSKDAPQEEEPLNNDLTADEPDLRKTRCLTREDRKTPYGGPAPARLMTSYEYKNTIRDLPGLENVGDVIEEFPPENKVNGFENNVDAHVASTTLIRRHMEASEEIAKKAVENNLNELLPCDPMQVGEVACGEKFVEDFLHQTFRRPPTKEEVADFVALFEKGRSDFDFITGIELTIQAALQSPQFLYRIRTVDGASEGETVQLDPYEMAERLSYFLWASTPDAKLMQAAADGALQTREQNETQTRRMLGEKNTKKAKNAVYQFHRQWLKLDELESMAKDSKKFPEYQPEMADDWHASMRKFILDVYFSENSNVDHLLSSPTIYLTDRLAKLYDRKDMKGSTGLQPYKFESKERSGLLTQPALMALLANANQSSPIQRGVWVREQLLCQPIQPPPPSSTTTPPDPDPNATTRERFRQHTEDPECASCHKMIDPLGFGFANYDGVGRYRAKENGKAVNAKGELANTGETAVEGPFDGAVELAGRLRDSRMVSDCIASRWFTYAMGRSETNSDVCALHTVQKAFAKSEGDFEKLLVELATSDAFRYRRVAQKGETQ